MRIVECIHSLQPGGAERFLVDLSNELSLKHEVVILTLKNRDCKNENFYKDEVSSRVKFISLGFKDGFHLTYLFKIYRTIKTLQPDAVHLHCVLQYLILAVLFYRKCQYVQTLHNKAEYGIPKIIRRLAFWTIKRNFLKLVTISDTNRQSFRAYSGLSNDYLIYNGRKRPEQTPLYSKTKEFIEGLRSSKEDIVLLCIAKCAPQKNIGLLIDSVNYMSKSGQVLKLLIIGDNYQNTALGKQWIDSARNNPSIHFLGTKKNVADYFYLCDAFCLSSLYEGMPITLIEALACGCIPISTPVSGIVDLLEDGKTGFISNDFSVSSYVNTLRRFVENRSVINIDRLSNLYTTRFSIEKSASEYLKVFGL